MAVRKPKMDPAHEETERLIAEMEKKISKEYAKAEKELQTTIDDYFDRFRLKDQKWQEWVKDGTKTKEQYKQWRIGQMAVGKRWENLKQTVSEDLYHADLIAKSITKGYMAEVYANNFNYGTYEVEVGAKVDTSFTLYDRQSVERLMRDDPTMLPAPGKKVSKEIAEGKAVRWNKQQLQSVMTQGILQGESIPKLAERLAKEVGDSDMKAAIRNARTMTTGAQNAGRVDSYKRAEDMGIKMEQMWRATLDDRTRHEHRMLDGQKVKVGEPFEVEGYEIEYPGDPTAEPFLIYNCRCTLKAVVAGLTPQAEKLRDDSAIGMTYDEWKAEKKSESKSILDQKEKGEAIAESYRNEYRKGGKTPEPVEDTKESKIIIPEDVEKSISDFEKKYASAKTEHYRAINKDGKIIYESGQGGSRSVGVPKHIDEQMEGGFSIHNHPADAIFSSADISNYEKYGEHGLVVDKSGNEYLLYNTNPMAKYKEIEKAQTDEEYEKLMPFSVAAHKKFTEIDDEIMKARREFSKNLMEKEPDRAIRSKKMQEWMKEHNAEELKASWLEENAEKYGFIFRRKKL